MTSDKVVYAVEPNLAVPEFRDVLFRSKLAARRPAEDAACLAGMLKHADVILTARSPDGLLIGVSRAISDFHYCTYLSDLAVDEAWQRRGIGRELIRRTHVAAGLQSTLILLSAPAARDYYPRVGMQPHDSCWLIPGQDPQ